MTHLGALCCNPFKPGPTGDTTKTTAQHAGGNIYSDSDSAYTRGLLFALNTVDTDDVTCAHSCIRG